MMKSWCVAGPLLTGVLVASAAQAQTYPAKNILILLPVQAGSAGDIAVRVMAQKMSENVKQQIVIENQAGAAGLIGAQRLARMTPDGYVLGGLSDSVVNYAPSLAEKPGFDPVNDFAPISLICTIPWVLVTHPSLPAQDLRGLIALAKAAPGKIDYASAGNGSPHHIVMELFKRAAGIDVNHIPYRGAAQSIVDLVAGQVSLAFSATVVPLPHIKDGKLHALAVPSDKRSALLPAVPTMAEAGVPGFQFDTWIGLFAPKGTPKAVIDRLNAETAVAMSDGAVSSRLTGMALEPRSSTPEELGNRTRDGYARVSRVIKEANIKAD
jgi:tripartite-type tricarboxylate transporter receptor subunit TctC